MSEAADQYWATLPPDELAARCMDKVRAYRRWFVATGFAEKARRGWSYANGWTDSGATSSKLQAGSEDGSTVSMVVNGIRPLRQRTVAMVMSGAPEMVPVAANSDAAAREQADLAKGVEEHLSRTLRLEQHQRETLTTSLDMGEGFMVQEWDARAGKPVAPGPVPGPDGQPMLGEDGMPLTQPAEWEGDFRIWVASAFDVYRDTGIARFEDAPWLVVRRRVSKWALMARYPEKYDDILRATPERDPEDLFDPRMLDMGRTETDFVDEYIFWHKDAPELPGGREFRFLSGSVWLEDGTYPYDAGGFPAERLPGEAVTQNSLGYSNTFDALGTTDMVNGVVSAMATNVTVGAVPPLMEFANSAMSPGGSVGTGHKVLKVSTPDAAPKFMDSPETPPEAYKFLDMLKSIMLESQGLNETSIGKPPYSGMAAQAMALLDAKTDEFQDGQRSNYRTFLANTATFRLRCLKRFAKTERLAQIVGKSKQWMVKSFSAEKLKLVDGFHVEPVAAASRTLSGRLGMLDYMKQFQVPVSPEQLVEFFQTGQYESDFQAPRSHRYRVAEENEMLMLGQVPPMLAARPHWTDIPEHLALLNSPSVIDRPEMVQAVTQTVMQKLQLWREMPPDMLMLLNGPPAPQPMMPPPPASPPGGPAGPSGAPPMPPPPGATNPAGALQALNADGPQQQPNLPSPPPGPAA